MSPAYETACAAWTSLLADDTPWGAVDDDALLAALEARDRTFDAASRATADIVMAALSPTERERLTGLLARVASATLSLEQRVMGRRAAIAAALDASSEPAAPASVMPTRSPYGRPLGVARVDVRR